MSASLSTHVLDTAAGRPAAGVTVELLHGRRAGRERGDRRRRPRPPRRGARARRATASSSTRRRRSSAGSSSSSSSSRRPLPRAPPRLPVLVRELPRQLSAEELAELFEGRTRFVELLAEREDPLEHAPEVIADALRRRRSTRCSTPTRRSGRRRACRRARRPSRAADVDPEVLAELARLNAEYEARHGFRFVVFVNRRPKAEILEVLQGADRQPDRRRARDGARRARRDRDRPLAARMTAATFLDPYWHRLAQPADPLAARDRRDRVDRRLVLLRPPRPVARGAEEPRTTSATASAASCGRSTAAASTT